MPLRIQLKESGKFVASERYSCPGPLRGQEAEWESIRRVLPEVEVVTEALDSLPLGILLTDAKAGVAFANICAIEIIQNAQALEVRDGRLLARDPNKTLALWRIIAEVLAAATPNEEAAQGGVAVSRPPPSQPVLVTIKQLRSYTLDPTGTKPLAMILLDDPERDNDAARQDLVRLYGLTPTEAKFTLALLDGCGLDSAARRLSISRNTARTHLKRIFEKTRTHRQAELVALVLRGATLRRSTSA